MATSVIKSFLSNFVPSYDTLALNSGITGEIRILRYGKIRALFGNCNPNVASATTLLSTLAEGDRPPITMRTAISGYSSTSNGELTVYADGRIVMPLNNVPVNNVKFSVMYAVS